MRGLIFTQGDLSLNWVYYPQIFQHEVSTRLSTNPSSYSRYCLLTTVDNNDQPSYNISPLDENYGCYLSSFLSVPESELNDSEIQDTIQSSLSLDPRVTFISSDYIGNGNISVTYKPSDSFDPSDSNSFTSTIVNNS